MPNVPSNQASWQWKKYFSQGTLENAKNDLAKGRIKNYKISGDGSKISCKTVAGFYVSVNGIPRNYKECVSLNDSFDSIRNSPYYRKTLVQFFCSCSAATVNHAKCRHVASLLLYWDTHEQENVFEESEEERKERLKEEEQRRIRQEQEEERRRIEREQEEERRRIWQEQEEERRRKEQEQRRIWEEQEAERRRIEQEQRRIWEEQEAERRRKEAIKQKKINNVFPAIEYIRPRVVPVPPGTTFAPDRYLENFTTNELQAEGADVLLSIQNGWSYQKTLFYSTNGEQQLEVKGSHARSHAQVRLVLGREKMVEATCSCGITRFTGSSYYFYDYSDRYKLCCHVLSLYSLLWNDLVQTNPGDDTDKNGEKLMSLLTEGLSTKKIIENTTAAQNQKKNATVILEPRITTEKDKNLILGFFIGFEGGRLYVLKNLKELVDAVEGERVYSPAGNLSIPFDSYEFREDSKRWYDLIASRVRNVASVNERLNRNSYYYATTLPVGKGIPMEGSDLDLIYDMTEGQRINYQEGGSGKGISIPVGPCTATIALNLLPIKTGGVLTGISIEGSIPRLLQGSQYPYILDNTRFGRIAPEEISDLEPFKAIASDSGAFKCRVGTRKLTDFYYRVLPEWQKKEQFLITDKVGEDLLALLPPEPQFTFFLDLYNDFVVCRPEVSYGNEPFLLTPMKAPDPVRDQPQEKRVLQAVAKYFPYGGTQDFPYGIQAKDENVMQILTEGVAVLSSFGEVKRSTAFSAVHVRPVSASKVSVEIDGGLLNLSIETTDMSPEELLDLLQSYRQRKRWVRLKNGDFIDLQEDAPLREIEDLAQSMNVPLEDLINGGVKLPLYRALYVDRLLEAHEEMASDRDRHFKSLVRSFKTIKDSDFEVEESLSSVMRPYQLYGFRWLSTLAAAGFGGILADEMGLGKTLQMLSFLLSQKEAGETLPSLVVCPASLVYNWGEEVNRFTPQLKTVLVTGTVTQRKENLSKLSQEEGAGCEEERVDLYVTSYDLLKRDVTLYDGASFASVILDEAQYVKNQSALVSKTVKVLKANHRFALTGTPIENRLSELWSIFDFLMPGFLYSSRQFSEIFETPSVKRGEEAATHKLARMTEPFILRRKKMDVLKDLPEKLEEVQAAAMEPDQRRMYDAKVVFMKQMIESSSGSGEEKMQILAEITKLRLICCDPSLVFPDYKGTSTKREACLNLIERAIDEGHRMLVFSQFTSMLSLLEKDLKKAKIPYYILTGSTPKQERLRLVGEFNRGDTPVFLISLKAGGTGLNLTGADVVIHYDPWWNLAVQNQATDRAHRIGQTKQVTVIKLIAVGTIEEKIVELQEAKRDLAESIMSGEGGSLMNLSKEELLELLS